MVSPALPWPGSSDCGGRSSYPGIRSELEQEAELLPPACGCLDKQKPETPCALCSGPELQLKASCKVGMHGKQGAGGGLEGSG